ncbi:MAG: CehA/McbA family metallohydrolase, partial [bacterium]|nr:CehA/McbA family metallohydrolase [bacterium]
MPDDRRGFLRNCLMGGASMSALSSAQSDSVTCRIVDAATEQPVPARLRLLDASGREVLPIGHSAELAEDAQEGDVRFQSRRYAYVKGEFTLKASDLPVRYQVLKGFEHQIAEGEIAGPATIPMRRWSNLTERGWYSGDIHIHHIAPETCRLEMDAEDLHVANLLTSDFTTDQDLFEGQVNASSSGNHLIYVNQEFRHPHLGHMCLLNLTKLVEPVTEIQPHHHPLHMRVCDEVHRQGGYVSWAHFPSWPGLENPLDVAMEKLDGLEILSVLEPRELPIFVKHVVPEIESNDGLRLWYRYLNCGFHLTATAGTDKMTTFVTVGANRVYAHLEDDFGYEAWIRALRAGRTFITNSPVLSFTVNGAEPGARLNVTTKQRTLEIHARAESQLPYHHLEIVANGRVIAEATPSGERHTAEINIEHPLEASAWIAARAFEDIGGYRARQLDFTTVHIDEG